MRVRLTQHESVNVWPGCYPRAHTGLRPYADGPRALSLTQLGAAVKPIERLWQGIVDRGDAGVLYSIEVVEGPFYSWLRRSSSTLEYEVVPLKAMGAVLPNRTEHLACSIVFVRPKISSEHVKSDEPGGGVFFVERHPSRFANNMKPFAIEAVNQVGTAISI
jgi:hypothetical protein